MNFSSKLFGFCSFLVAATTPTLALADCQSRLVPSDELQECTDDPRATWSAGMFLGISRDIIFLQVGSFSGELRSIHMRAFNENQDLIDGCDVVLSSPATQGFDICSELVGFHETTMVP